MTGSGLSERKIFLPHGYELAHYTLRRVHDEHPQSYSPVDGSATPVHDAPATVRLSDLELPRAQHSDPGFSIINSPISNVPTHQNPSGTQVSSQQLYNIPIRGGPKSFAHRHSETRDLSKRTQKRHAHSRDDYYTDVCGVYSPEKATPMKKFNYGKGEFYCPRCGSNYTRPKSVKDHFPDCVAKFGNPNSLRYTDDPSMAPTEAFIQRRGRASREASKVDTERDNDQTSENGEGVKLEEMDDALYVHPKHNLPHSAANHDQQSHFFTRHSGKPGKHTS